MEIVILKNEKDASVAGAKLVASLIRRKFDCVLGLATGNTPLMLYKELIIMYKERLLDLCRVTTFNLDEYVGLSPNHPASYKAYMWDHFFKYVNIPEHAVHIPNGMAPDIEAFCKQYEGAIQAAGGIDLQILGIGTDGHIGFNEPSSSLSSRTRIKTLTKQTRQDNAPHFGGDVDVPKHVITMGVGTIMEARQCLLLAFGKRKADAVARMVEGPVSSMIPASILQMHPRATVILDEAAASGLQRTDYYKWVFENKPEWQRQRM